MVFKKFDSGELRFQLVNFESREDFKIWDDFNKKYLSQVEGVANLDDLKFMKAALFTQKYPSFRKSVQIIREIVIIESGTPTQYSFGFKRTANDELDKAVQTCRNLGINPLEVEYIITKRGTKKETTYGITSGQRLGIPQNLVQPQPNPVANLALTPLEQANRQYNLTQQLVAQPKPSNWLKQGFSVPKPVVDVPSAEEMTIINEANLYPDKLSEADFIAGFNHSLQGSFGRVVTEDRARKWYYQYYVKK